jgi:transposase-like protein
MLLHSLKTRGLNRVLLVIFNDPVGLNWVIDTVFQGEGWQQRRMHNMGGLLGHGAQGPARDSGLCGAHRFHPVPLH